MTQRFHSWEYIWRNLKHHLERKHPPHVHRSVIYNSQTREAAQVPRDESIKKLGDEYSTMEHDWGIKKKEVLPSATAWMDPEGIMLSAISQWEKDKYIGSHLCVESKEQ